MARPIAAASGAKRYGSDATPAVAIPVRRASGRAPRARALSSSSSRTTKAPSPWTMPEERFSPRSAPTRSKPIA